MSLKTMREMDAIRAERERLREVYGAAYAAVVAWRTDNEAATNDALLRLAGAVDRAADGGESDPRQVELEDQIAASRVAA